MNNWLEFIKYNRSITIGIFLLFGLSNGLNGLFNHSGFGLLSFVMPFITFGVMLQGYGYLNKKLKISYTNPAGRILIFSIFLGILSLIALLPFSIILVPLSLFFIAKWPFYKWEFQPFFICLSIPSLSGQAYSMAIQK